MLFPIKFQEISRAAETAKIFGRGLNAQLGVVMDQEASLQAVIAELRRIESKLEEVYKDRLQDRDKFSRND